MGSIFKSNLLHNKPHCSVWITLIRRTSICWFIESLRLAVSPQPDFSSSRVVLSNARWAPSNPANKSYLDATFFLWLWSFFSVFRLSSLLLRNRKKQNAELITERNFLGFSPEGFISDESLGWGCSRLICHSSSESDFTRPDRKITRLKIFGNVQVISIACDDTSEIIGLQTASLTSP